MSLIPATILTGFLGSGKTTLLKRILQEAHGQKIAVIENEFGEENIDSDILVSETKEQIIQMSNGCICCTIREDLRGALRDLAEKKRKGELDFDRVVIETTGLADPGPVAQTFFMDDEIAESYLLDSILTLVDAKHAATQLNDRQEARRQVGFADQIFISKTDLVAKDEVDALMHRLKHMNPRAPQKAVHFGEVALSEVFDLRGFNLNAKLEDFLGAIVNIYGPKMLRYKGVLHMQGTDRKVIFQGVHQLMGSDLGPAWGVDEKRGSKMVFIGIDLPKDIFLQGLQQCLT